MNGLRVYSPIINRSDSQTDVFLSRRDTGPFYLWRYDLELCKWCASRMHNSEVISQALNLATWKSLPASLRARLGEHYIE
jgi:hypothetical protein